MPRLLIACVSALIFVGLSSMARAEFREITGTAAYLERRAMPPDARLVVSLHDISLADAPSVELASILIVPQGQVPVAFRLLYDANAISEGMAYSVQAELHSGGRVMYRTTQVYPLLTGDPGSEVDLVMNRMPESRSAAILGSWRATEIAGERHVGEAGPTLTIAPGGEVTGTGGCNNFTGSAEIGDGVVEFGPLAATQRLCGPEIDTVEHAFFQALAAVARFELEDVSLALRAEDGTVLARFMPG